MSCLLNSLFFGENQKGYTYFHWGRNGGGRVEEAAGDRRRVAEAAGVEAGLLEAALRDLEGARRAPRAS